METNKITFLFPINWLNNPPEIFEVMKSSEENTGTSEHTYRIVAKQKNEPEKEYIFHSGNMECTHPVLISSHFVCSHRREI